MSNRDGVWVYALRSWCGGARRLMVWVESKSSAGELRHVPQTQTQLGRTGQEVVLTRVKLRHRQLSFDTVPDPRSPCPNPIRRPLASAKATMSNYSRLGL